MGPRNQEEKSSSEDLADWELTGATYFTPTVERILYPNQRFGVTRQEPYAVIPHVRIYAGGAEQSASLPRPTPAPLTALN